MMNKLDHTSTFRKFGWALFGTMNMSHCLRLATAKMKIQAGQISPCFLITTVLSFNVYSYGFTGFTNSVAVFDLYELCL